MAKSVLRWVVVGLVLCLVCIPTAAAEEGAYTNTIMHPDRETRLQWIASFEQAPSVRIDDRLRFEAALRGSRSLLGFLDYTPAERDQGSCGNCWAWAGTGVMGIALNVQEGIYDRLSVQYINSCNRVQSCCDGGWLSDFVSFYAWAGVAVPWSNTNAWWQDGDEGCDVSCDAISTLPSYAVASIGLERVSTHAVGQAQAIANIKGVLNQNRAVWFGFFMGTQEDWNSFYAFWNSQADDVLWDFDASCGKPYTSAGAGHAVLCVGYNDDDPNNSYWLMLNSWGTTAGRPNGLFRVDMDMDYDCFYVDGSRSFYSLYWQTLDVTFDISGEAVYVDPSGGCGGRSPCYSTILEAINASGARATINIRGGRYVEDVVLQQAKDITLQGGWDASFTAQSSVTTVDSLTVHSGTVTVQYIVCQ
jgi:hypothetical protein